jgi:NAD(P)H-quinone oxidoreductase subunit 5
MVQLLKNIHLYFHVDALAFVMLLLVGIVGLSLMAFSSRYLKGDSRYRKFFLTLTALIASVFIMVTADHIVLFLVAWGCSDLLLARLMVHKPNWRAARASGWLAVKNFAVGWVLIGAALGLLYAQTNETSIQQLIHATYDPAILTIALGLLFAGAMTQSGLWPFHRWLISSLNSPTPVSAIMHAGLVNGGGFLLARFAPLYLETPKLLTIIFAFGLVSAFLGTFWKLMQNDIKRMLACSTMGQMGFMIMQCGLGLFPAAIAHLCWHGLFKAYLFQASGSAAQEKRLDLGYPPTLSDFAVALLCGFAGAYAFAVSSHKSIFVADTNFFLVAIACVASTQFALSILKPLTWKRITIAFFSTTLVGTLYGLSVFCTEVLVKPLNIIQAQDLNSIHFIGLGVLVFCWLAVLFRRHGAQPAQPSDLESWTYVRMLNASQPHEKTITTHRNHYQN